MRGNVNGALVVYMRNLPLLMSVNRGSVANRGLMYWGVGVPLSRQMVIRFFFFVAFFFSPAYREREEEPHADEVYLEGL